MKKNLPETLIKSANLFPVVGIGASAGGLDAFKQLLKAIPEDSGMAFVLVQHLDPKHESLLPELLQKITQIPVLEITDDIKVQPDHIYVIPSNKMMVATDGVLLLAPRPPRGTTERNLPIDLFFTSLAEVHQEHAIGVVLSGTASDGTMGLKAIKDHGGITFAQDEASAEYEGMPNSAVQAGVVDFILPPGEIPKKLLEVTSKIKLSDDALQNIPKQDEDIFKQILSLLRIRKGVDFTYYKQTTVRRRILRRMVVNKNEETGDYLTFLRGSTAEQDLLYQDMLIPVTSFFRDKKVFDNLCNDVFPTILKNKAPGEIIRIWVAGCSTGQEVFSFAICFKEFLGDNHERIQIFGTDLSEPAIAKARTGMYEKSEVDAVSPERLKEYFTKINGGYQVNKSIRDMCVFAHHNFLKDPPFGKMDMIACRNVLIYMEPYLQKKALTTFHYALNPRGFLLLGKSETTGGVPDLFAAVPKSDKLYTRKDVPGRFMQITSQRSEQILNRTTEISIKDSDSSRNRTDFQKTADDILLSKYTPGGVVVNESMDIVHFRGNTANYLEQAAGKPSHNLMMMAKSGLGFELRNILHKAKADKVPVIKENVPLNVQGSIRNITIEAVPLPNTLEPYYLILFHDNNLINADGSVISNRKKVSAKAKKEEKDIEIKLLEQELEQAREDMRSITEDQEANNEELQSANEELLSGSEELQSLNEELETSKEELQSTNEELTVLNHELIGLNEQVTDARNYAESIVATLYQPLLVLDKNLRVKTANHAFYETFKVDEQETEGVLIYDLGNRQWNIPQLRNLLEEILPQKKQIADFEVTHNFLSIGERVILLNALELTREKKEEKLILLSIEDISESKAAAKKIEESEKRKAFLLKLSDALRQLSNPVDIEEAATKIAMDFMGADWCHYDTVEGDNLILKRGASRENFPSLAGVYPISSFTLFKSALNTGLPTIIDDVHTTDLLDEELKQLCVQSQNIAIVVVPIIKNGKPVGLLVLVQSKPRKWTGAEVQLTIETAERTWAAVERAKAEEALRKSEEKYRTLLTSIEQGFTLCELIRNKEGKGIDFYIQEVNSTYEQQTGISEEMVLGKPLLSVFPSLTKWMETYAAVVDNQRPVVFEHYFEDTERWFAIKAYPVGKDKFTVLFSDITERKRTEEKIKESEKQLRKISEHFEIATTASEVGIWSLDIATQILVWSNLHKKMWGYTNLESKLTYEDWYKLIVPEDKETAFAAVAKALETKTLYEANYRIKRADTQEERWIISTGQYYYNEAGEPVTLTGISMDITDKKKAELTLKESENQFRQMAELMPQKVWTADAKGHKTYFNQTLLDYAGFTFEELKGDGWQKIVHPDDWGKNKGQWEESISTGKDYEAENRLLRKDGKYLWHLTRAVAIKDETGKIKMWVGSKTEIQEQREQKLALEKAVVKRTIELDKANKKLIFESAEKEKRAAELVIANKKLMFESAEKEKRAEELIKMNKELEAFAYVSSHDLQEPLRKIQTFAGRILEKESTRLSVNGKKYFHIMQDSAHRMQTLIEDLLAFSGLTSAERKFEITDLNDIIGKIKIDLKETIQKKQATIEATQLCSANIIVFQFHQLMQNLISNALKYSRPKHPPHIVIKSSMVEGSTLMNHRPDLPAGTFAAEKKYCHISVTDNGIGFEQKFSEQIFEVFQKLHGKEEYAGTGIGLAIVRKIVDNHNGIITATGKLNKGATFDIFIPAI